MKKFYKALTVFAGLSLLLTSCEFTIGGNTSYKTKSSSSSDATSSSDGASSSDDSASSGTSSLVTYQITWKNYDGTELKVDEVNEGQTPSYNGIAPTKPSNEQYDYVFSGWNPEVVPAAEDAEYTAVFTEEVRKYTITWKNYDGQVLETDENVPYGSTPSYDGNDPVKEGNERVNYAFDGWDPEVGPVKGDKVYTAQYKEEARKYTITWKNYDNSILAVDQVPYGETPKYTGETPKRDPSKQYVYVFNGWTPVVQEVTEDATYKATFDTDTRTYSVTWKNYDGTILEEDKNVPYGTLPTYNGSDPIRDATSGVTFTWAGWNRPIVEVESDQTYTARFTSTGTFSFEQLDYELQPGYQKSDLRGAPWVNVNLRGELNKIKKPSLKDDFYTAVNYDKISLGVPGPFDIGANRVNDATNAVYNGTVQTTNSSILRQSVSLARTGDAEDVATYFANLDAEEYLSSKAIFSSASSYLGVEKNDSGYEVYFKDGYIFSDRGIQTIWFASMTGYTSFTNNGNKIIDELGSAFGFELSSSEKSDVRSIDGGLSSTVYNDYSRYFNNKPLSYAVSNLPWTYLKDALLDLGLNNSDTIIVNQAFKNALDTLFKNYAVNNIDGVKNSIITRLAFDYRIMLGASRYRKINSEMTSTGLFNDENYLYYTNDDYIAQTLTKVSFPYLDEQAYIDVEGDATIKQKVSKLIDDILDGYIDLVSELDWLSTTTKNGVAQKLANMTYGSCYSEYYKNFTQLKQNDLDVVSFLTIYNRYQQAIVDLAIQGKILEYTYWGYMSTNTINAFYSLDTNTFTILNGLVRGFMSDKVEELYGSLGFVVGHEITHAFDANGSQYDENGNYRDWWTGTDKTTFNNKVNKMINFYNNINLFGSNNASGNTVNTEATADMGGIKVMLQLAREIPNFDYDAFFRAAANTWCIQPYSDSEANSRLSDAHPFAYLRVNVTLAQFDEFVETYNIQPGDGMFIPSNERVKIW